MLTSIDHIVLVCPDIKTSMAEYTALLGCDPVWVSQNDNTETALFRVENTALELIAPVKNTKTEAQISKLLNGRAGALTSLAFKTDDIEKMHHVLVRRGLAPSAVKSVTSLNKIAGETRHWQSFRCPDKHCAEVKTFILEPKSESLSISAAKAGGVVALDHLVINTPNPERAIAHYGARLGLRFALDRTIEAFNTRFLFFRIGGLTLEIIHRTDQDHALNDPDHIWGLTWKVSDLAAAHKRLAGAGLDISDIRTGRKPGTTVFTVRSGTLGIPTLFLADN